MAVENKPHERVSSLMRRFGLIGDPVEHSLSPIMHNTVYRYLSAQNEWMRHWTYDSFRCETQSDAIDQIARVRTGEFRGLNVTMPWKKLALQQADYADAAADAAGGANVLVLKGFDLYAYNTDGLGAVGAIAREGHINPRGKRAAVCGTGPTSMAIATALANSNCTEVVLFSRDKDKAEDYADQLRLSLDPEVTYWITPASYDEAPRIVPKMDILVDATPRGMQKGDEAIVDTGLLHEGQVVLDVVYGHGLTKLVEGARNQGAVAIDGVEMLVEQAALSIEIWAESMNLSVRVPRVIMRNAAVGTQRQRENSVEQGQ